MRESAREECVREEREKRAREGERERICAHTAVEEVLARFEHRGLGGQLRRLRAEASEARGGREW